MLKTMEGIYRNGKVELLEKPPNVQEARVIITFLQDVKSVDLRTRGISHAQAADLRARLGAIAEDWERPEMDIYDEL